MRRPLAALVAAAIALPAAAAADATYSPSLNDAGHPLLAKAKKRKKKEGDDFGPADLEAAPDNDGGAGIHRDQIGVDVPYKAEAGGDGDIAFLNRKTGAADATSVTAADINVRILFILGRAELGGEVGILYDAEKSSGTAPATGSTAANGASTTTGLALVPIFKWNFRDINRALTVPFAYAGAGYALQQSKPAGGDTAKAAGPIVKVGAGLDLFLTGFAAINPAVEYRIKTLTPAKGDATTESGVHLLGGFTLFL